MAKLIWGTPGDRFYETGVDRGVLYPNGASGVAWNGLTAVREAPSGGEPTAHYLDGFKYVNVASAEEFEATLEAFSSPSAFSLCDGTAAISNGLFITQQPRRSFGLSYRSRIGNAIDGIDHGYKIHLVYNALAAPSSRDHATVGTTTEPTMLSWHISTSPPVISGYKPTAHFVVDTRLTAPSLLAQLEDILYGTDASNAELPSPTTLLAMFSSP